MDQVSFISGSRKQGFIYDLGVLLCSISFMSVCFCTGFMGLWVVSVAFSEKVCVWFLHWQLMELFMFWLFSSLQSLIAIVRILVRGWYEMISGNMGVYLCQ